METNFLLCTISERLFSSFKNGSEMNFLFSLERSLWIVELAFNLSECCKKVVFHICFDNGVEAMGSRAKGIRSGVPTLDKNLNTRSTSQMMLGQLLINPDQQLVDSQPSVNWLMCQSKFSWLLTDCWPRCYGVLIVNQGVFRVFSEQQRLIKGIDQGYWSSLDHWICL